MTTGLLGLLVIVLALKGIAAELRFQRRMNAWDKYFTKLKNAAKE